MRAVVAVPPIHDFYFTTHRFASLGAHTVADILREKNIKVSLFNFPLRESHEIPFESGLKYLQPFIIPEEQDKCAFFTKYKHFGPIYTLCAIKIMATNPEIVFLSCFAFCYADQTIELARAIKKENPHIPVALGGAGATAYPGYFLKDASIDFLFSGEAELSLPQFADALLIGAPVPEDVLAKIPNLLWKNNLPSGKKPAVHLFTKQDDLAPVIVPTHQTRNALYFSTMLSRGCPKQCRFCSNHLSMGAAWRRLDYDLFFNYAEATLQPFQENGRQIYLNFEDDNFLLDPAPFFALCERLRARFSGISFLAENGIDYRELSETTVVKLVEAGFGKFNLSLATLDDRVAGVQMRALDCGHYTKIARLLAEKKIPLTTYFICGLPGDTRQTIAQALAFLASQPTLIGISPFYAVPGMADFPDSRIFDKLPSNAACGSACFPWAARAKNKSASVTTQTLVTAFRLSRFINCCNLESPSPAEKELIQKIKKEKRLYTIIGKRKNETTLMAVENMDQELVDLFFTLR